MTYVILYDGFDTEGWESIQKLFEPSFSDDNVKIYMQDDLGRAAEIEDTIDRSVQHTFIFLTVQKPLRKGKNSSLIDKYRYKTLLDEIRREFTYCEHQHNILCVIDRIPKNIGNGLYSEEEKEIALSLDKFGYLDQSEKKYFFTIEDLLHIKNEIFMLLKATDKISRDKFGQKIEDILQYEVDKKIKALRDQASAKTRIARIEKMQKLFLKSFWELELSSYDRREALIINTLKRVFSESIGILGSLNHISILTYRPEQIHEEDSEMHITIASLISLIANRTENILKKGWFEVSKIETNKIYLQKALEKLSSIRLPQVQNNKELVSIHNLSQLNHALEPFKEPRVFKTIENLPWIYSSKKERGIKEEIDKIWNLMFDEIVLLSENLNSSKDDIYGHPGAKTDKEYTYDEIKEEANKALVTSFQDPIFTKEDLLDELNNISSKKIKSKFTNYFDKLPSVGTYWLSFFVFFMIIFLMTLIPESIWTIFSLTLINGAVLITMFLLSWIPVWYYRKEMKSFLSEYVEKIKKIQVDAHKWHDLQIESFKYSFETKLQYENRIFFREKLQKIENTKKKWKLHNNRVHELNKIAEDIARRLNLSLDSEEKWLPIGIIDEDIGLTKEYALFSQKNKIDEIVTDRTKTNHDLECYGMIKNLEIQRIENGV